MKKLLITSVLLFSAPHLKASDYYRGDGRGPWGDREPMPEDYYDSYTMNYKPTKSTKQIEEYLKKILLKLLQINMTIKK